jgi:hypothetical protein
MSRWVGSMPPLARALIDWHSAVSPCGLGHRRFSDDRSAADVGQKDRGTSKLVGAGLLDQATPQAELTTAAGSLISADCDCTAHEVVQVITAGPATNSLNRNLS